MSAAVCLALSHKLLHKLREGPAVVAGLVLGLVTFFFPFPRGFITLPLSLAFLLCPSGTAFETWGLGFNLLLVSTTGHGIVTGVFVVVVTMACNSLNFLLYDLLRSFCLFNLA